MIKKLTALALASLLMQAVYVLPVAAKSKAEQEARFAAKVKAGIARLGTGPEAHIEVKLRDNTKLKGYVSAVTDAGFVVTDQQTGTATPVAYPQVKQAKGNNLSQGARIAIGVGIALALGVILAIVIGRDG